LEVPLNRLIEGEARSVCPVCGARDVTESWDLQAFEFGTEHPVELQARVPVLTCQSCRFAFTDDRAEDIRHDEACRHQNLITGAEVKRLREEIYGISRKDFEKHFGTSEASLERWENRKVFPSRQATTLLRLLFDRSIGERAMQNAKSFERPKLAEVGSRQGTQSRFPALELSEAWEARARNFKLRLSADLVH
jgi:DNA-binding transcriptional regulator YiaG